MEGTDDDWGPLSQLPGNPMMWVLLLGELGVFGALLLGFAIARALDTSTFVAGQEALHPILAGVNTAVLVTSGFLMAGAVTVRHEGRSGRVHVLAAMVLGLAFLATKAIEYTALFAQGFGIETNTFFRLYFLITGFHALHIAFGLVLLGVVWAANTPKNLETGAAFWHMLDLIWVFIYPVVYLSR